MASGLSRPLPWCEGPKLAPYKFHNEKRSITFVRLLGSAVHSHVFEVMIDGAAYALKMVCDFSRDVFVAEETNPCLEFKFLHPREYWPYVSSDPAPVDIKLLVHHKDPFYSECRAFGRLKEAGREDLAVRCYGYIIIDRQREAEILQRFRIADWDRSPSDEGTSIRAIVKELIQPERDFTPRMIPQMMQDLKDINALGIQVWDVKRDMYRDGVLLDLSQARTVPHLQLDLESGLWSKKVFLRMRLRTSMASISTSSTIGMPNTTSVYGVDSDRAKLIAYA